MWAYLARRLYKPYSSSSSSPCCVSYLTRLSSDPMAQYANRPGLTAADRETIRESLGLDQPMFPYNTVKWLGLALQGDLGNSFFSKQPVLLMIRQRLPMTLILMVTAEVFIIIISLILGLVAAHQTIFLHR